MHQIVCRLGLHPDPAGGVYSAPQTSYLDFRGRFSKGEGRDEKGREGRGEEGREGEGKGW